MPVTAKDRPIAALREETIDQLIVNYGHGRLSLEAFERRLDEALEAQSHDALLALTADLDLAPDRAYAEKKEAELGHGVEALSAASEDDDYMIHVFSGGKRQGPWTVASTIRMLNVFGGVELDFTNARLSAPVTRIKTLCLFGGATLYVPENFNTVSKALCIFGGIDNRAGSGSPGAPTLVIEGLLLFGGVSVKVKKSLRERWLAFADGVRSMFDAPAETRPRRMGP